MATEKPPLKARRSLQGPIRNRGGEDIFIGLVEVVAGCAGLIHVTAPSLANWGDFGLRVFDMRGQVQSV